MNVRHAPGQSLPCKTSPLSAQASPRIPELALQEPHRPNRRELWLPCRTPRKPLSRLPFSQRPLTLLPEWPGPNARLRLALRRLHHQHPARALSAVEKWCHTERPAARRAQRRGPAVWPPDRDCPAQMCTGTVWDGTAHCAHRAGRARSRASACRHVSVSGSAFMRVGASSRPERVRHDHQGASEARPTQLRAGMHAHYVDVDVREHLAPHPTLVDRADAHGRPLPQRLRPLRRVRPQRQCAQLNLGRVLEHVGLDHQGASGVGLDHLGHDHQGVSGCVGCNHNGASGGWHGW